MKSISIANNILIPQIKKLIDEGHTTTFRVRGVSMRIFLEDKRDMVLLCGCKEPPKKGDVILAEVLPSHYVLHRIIKVEGTHYTLQGDGNIRGVEECELHDIIGIVRQSYERKILS